MSPLALVLLLAPQVPPAAREAWDAGRRAEALERLAAGVERGEGGLAARAELVRWELATHRALSAWEHLAASDARELDALRGQTLYLLGRYEDALPFLDGADAEHTLARHDALAALGRADEARAALEQAAAVLGRDHPRVAALQGAELAAAGRHGEAAERFRAALAADPLEQQARFGLGRSLLALGRRDEGLAELAEHRRLVPLIDRLEFARKGLDLAPLHAPNLAELGDCERALGRLDRAEAAYRRALEVAVPDEVAPVALRLARLLREDRGEAELALRALDLALARAEDPRLLVRAGDYLLELGRPREAVPRFERALALDPGAAPILERLAAARAAAGGRDAR